MFFLLYKHTDNRVFDDFPKISDNFLKVSKDFPKLSRLDQTDVPNFRKFTKMSKDFQRFPKIAEDFQGRAEDVSMIHQRKT